MGAGFRFPLVHDIWEPLAQMPGVTTQKRDVRTLSVVGRLADRRTLSGAQSEIDTIAARLARDYPATNARIRPVMRPFTGTLFSGGGYWADLLGAVTLVLLIACTNVANLLLARSARRSREIAIRASLGATRWRIVRQLLVETFLLATLAGVLGFVVSVLGVRLWVISLPVANWPYWYRWTMDARVYTFLVTVCLGAAIVFGLAPALHTSNANTNESLKESGCQGAGGIAARRWTTALLVTEVALTLMLLAGAGLMMRTTIALYRADAIVDSSKVLLASVTLPTQKYPTAEQRMAFYQRLQERLRAVSAMASGTIASAMPFFGAPRWSVEFDGRPAGTRDVPPSGSYVVIGSGYFETLAVRLLRGRPFDDLDGSPGHESAIVNQRFVSMYFQGEDPIGMRIRVTNPTAPDASAPWIAVVGVSPTVRQQYGQDLDPVVYVPARANPGRGMTLIVRGQAEAAALTPLLREEVRALDADLPLANIIALDQLLAGTRFANNVFATMFIVFSALALLLSAIGLYAVTAYSVIQRTGEIGVRMALGAQPRQVVWLFVHRTIVVLAVGLIVGLGGALAVGRLLESLLVQTSPTDWLTLVSIGVLLALVALSAAFVPARRATEVDPMVALRYE